MKITYGCECIGCQPHTKQKKDPKKAPVIGIFHREMTNQDLRLCTRCIIHGDKLVTPLMDDETPIEPLFEYDPLLSGCAYLENNKRVQDITLANKDKVIAGMKKDIEELGLPIDKKTLDDKFK